MTILKFPHDKSLLNQLQEHVDELNELYKSLNKAFTVVNAIEEKITGAEAHYDEILKRYSKAVGGIEHVEVRWLEYSSGIGVDVDSGNIVFTPWEGDDEDPDVS